MWFLEHTFPSIEQKTTLQNELKELLLVTYSHALSTVSAK